MNKIHHISFIMDGNKRWSKKNNEKPYKSYLKGADNLINLTKYLFDKYNIDYVSAFALSSHNLKRSKTTMKMIITILDKYLDKIIIYNKKYNFNIRFIGDFNFLDERIKNKVLTINSNQIKEYKTLVIAINYSGQKDIENSAGSDDFHRNISTVGVPDPDILIRTGGYNRLSDFFLYQCSFTELFFVKTLWPDFSTNKLKNIISKYLIIERKFGK